MVIHTVGPDLRYLGGERHRAVRLLSECYRNILAAFAGHAGLRCLRLLPVSGGIFSGSYAPEMPAITAEALANAFACLSDGVQRRLLHSATSVELCVFSTAATTRKYADMVSRHVERRGRSDEPDGEDTTSTHQTARYEVHSNLLVCAVVDDARPEDHIAFDRFVSGPPRDAGRRVKHVGDAMVAADGAHVGALRGEPLQQAGDRRAPGLAGPAHVAPQTGTRRAAQSSGHCGAPASGCRLSPGRGRWTGRPEAGAEKVTAAAQGLAVAGAT